jgi:hypothetical protein
VSEERLDALGVIERSSDSSALWRAQDHRNVQLAVGAVADFCGFAYDLIYGGPDKVGELDLRDGTHPVDRCAYGDSRYGRFGQWSVDDPLLAELLQETVSRQEHAASRSDVFAQDEHALVTLHFLTHGLAHCF